MRWQGKHESAQIKYAIFSQLQRNQKLAKTSSRALEMPTKQN